MQIQSLQQPAFGRYGALVTDIDFTELILTLLDCVEQPDLPGYQPSVPQLEALPIFGLLQERFFGGQPIQIGLGQGSNTRLNGLEYHRSSELIVAAQPNILLLGHRGDIRGGRYDTAQVEAFLMPAGTAVELYCTTLHFTPCRASEENYCNAVVLPRGTNLPLAPFSPATQEEQYLFANNKWLLAHSDSAVARNGAYIGLVGENLDVAGQI